VDIPHRRGAVVAAPQTTTPGKNLRRRFENKKGYGYNGRRRSTESGRAIGSGNHCWKKAPSASLGAGDNTGETMPRNKLILEETPCEELHLTVPCELAKRIRHYTSESGSDLTQVVIEALDTFLRRENK
jgi:hypothetical protein